MRARNSREGGRRSCLIAAALAAVLALSSVPIADVAASSLRGRSQGSGRVPVPTRGMLASLGVDVPSDPYAAAGTLVSLAYDPDPEIGAAAVTEILRRAGIPVVSPDGPVVALPDDLVLVDALTYDGSVADVASSVRQGDGWALSDFTEGLKGLGAIAEFVEPAHMAAAMGDLGRNASDPTEVRFAGAVMRLFPGTAMRCSTPAPHPTS